MAPTHKLPDGTGDNPNPSNRKAGRWGPRLKRAGRMYALVSWAGKGWHYLFNEDDGLLTPLLDSGMGMF